MFGKQYEDNRWNEKTKNVYYVNMAKIFNFIQKRQVQFVIDLDFAAMKLK